MSIKAVSYKINKRKSENQIIKNNLRNKKVKSKAPKGAFCNTFV